MNLAVICFTESGYRVIEKIKKMEGYKVYPYCKCSALKEHCNGSYVEEPVSEWAKVHFKRKDALVFVGAMGIAVRSIAGLVSSKLEDPPVIVIDDKGQFVIPVLSGHVGGANELAKRLAKQLQATAVITTATDIHHKISIDVFAKKNHLRIMNKEAIAKVSSKALRGEKIVMGEDVIIGTDDGVKNPDVLYLKPMEYIVGIGCKKGKTKEGIKEVVLECLEKLQISHKDLFCLASIDIKKDEPGIVELAEEWQVAFQTFSPEQLKKVSGDFSTSDFVAKKVGVDNVCERAAVLAAGEGSEIILPKMANNGVTVAIVKMKRRIVFDE